MGIVCHSHIFLPSTPTKPATVTAKAITLRSLGTVCGWRRLQIQYLMLDSPCLKDTKSGASAMGNGSDFHVMIVLRKKLFWQYEVEAEI